uniref:Uncharacterized protein n=1 Tax=Burkholderia phage vB_BgluM-SURPRISE13 TaxID=3159457 RepID=A0AAU7PFN6_9VIRU
MATMAEITDVAGTAINQAMHHYFVNLATSGDDRNNEAQFVAEVLMQVQGWLLFTEDSLQNIQDLIYKDTLHINLVYTLTALFRTRFILPEQDYQTYIEHLANSFNTKEAADPRQSFMSAEYSDRIPDPAPVANLLKNNRHLVMLATFFVYGDPNVLADAIGK